MLDNVFDRLTFERYIGLRKSYAYNVALLCRLEDKSIEYRFLRIGENPHSFQNRISHGIIRLMQFIRRYKISLLMLLLFCIFLLFAYVQKSILVLGFVSVAIMPWYIVVLIVQNEIKHHEVLIFDFVNDEQKEQGEKCLRFLSESDDNSLLDFLSQVTEEHMPSVYMTPEFYNLFVQDYVKNIETNLPYMKLLQIYAIEDNTFKIIERK